MSLFPPLSLGWLNGWIPLILFYGSFLILLRTFPKSTVDRLYDNSGWTLAQARPAKIGLPFALAGLALIVFSSLKLRQEVFWIGLIFFLAGWGGFIWPLVSFNAAPLNEPVTAGLYRISRNPQWVAFALTLVGVSLMVGSWTILALLMVRMVMNHFRILGEEIALESQYGESYLEYKSSIPRYFLFVW